MMLLAWPVMYACRGHTHLARQDPQIARDAQGQLRGLARTMSAHRSPASPPRVG